MDYKESDFKSLRYNVRAVKDSKDLIKEFHGLAKIKPLCEIPEVHNGIPRNAIVRYISYMYDPGSPLPDDDLMKKKYEAAVLAGMPMANRRFTKEVNDLLVGGDKLINKAIVAFAISFNSATFSKLVAFQELYQKRLQDTFDDDYDSKDVDLIKAIDALEQSINKMQIDLLKEWQPQLIDELYNEVASSALGLRPEDIADKIQDGEQVVDVHPYGGDYDFKKYPWKGVRLTTDTKQKEG